jgi:hypothetical protein
MINCPTIISGNASTKATTVVLIVLRLSHSADQNFVQLATVLDLSLNDVYKPDWLGGSHISDEQITRV